MLNCTRSEVLSDDIEKRDNGRGAQKEISQRIAVVHNHNTNGMSTVDRIWQNTFKLNIGILKKKLRPNA